MGALQRIKNRAFLRVVSEVASQRENGCVYSANDNKGSRNVDDHIPGKKYIELFDEMGEVLEMKDNFRNVEDDMSTNSGKPDAEKKNNSKENTSPTAAKHCSGGMGTAPTSKSEIRVKDKNGLYSNNNLKHHKETVHIQGVTVPMRYTYMAGSKHRIYICAMPDSYVGFPIAKKRFETQARLDRLHFYRASPVIGWIVQRHSRSYIFVARSTIVALYGFFSVLQGEWEYEDSTSSTLDLVSTLLRLIHARRCVWMSRLHLAPWRMVCHLNESVRLSTHAADPKYEKAATEFMQKTAWEHDQVNNVLRHLDSLLSRVNTFDEDTTAFFQREPNQNGGARSYGRDTVNVVRHGPLQVSKREPEDELEIETRKKPPVRNLGGFTQSIQLPGFEAAPDTNIKHVRETVQIPVDPKPRPSLEVEKSMSSPVKINAYKLTPGRRRSFGWIPSLRAI
ncbi:MAG: hypothetical protein ASARMPREDX12_007882 [Alectoria sarmentosa]|nr:MAG: hypothetical protein ASARMPREDX12_007882 [Alectoria sarmentosa]